MAAKKLMFLMIFMFCSARLWATAGNGTITQTQVGNVITINIQGDGEDLEAGNISIYLYFRDDGTTDLSAGNVNVSQIETTFGWGTTFVTGPVIQTGTYSKGGHSFTRRMYYDNVDLGDQDDTWTDAGINAIVCTFTTINPSGHLYVELSGPAGLADWAGTGYHNVSYVNQDLSLPVQMGNISAVAKQESGISIEWRTESESNSAGFHIWKSVGNDDQYSRITTEVIPSHGNSTAANEYSYLDREVEEGVMYWYKVEEESNDGSSQLFGPISVMGIHAIPTEFKLSKNFPNPFNPETRFEYQLAEDSEVRISVYSLLGQKVTDLVSEHQEAGYYDSNWDGRNQFGNRVASGIYILHMQAGDFRDMQKMMIIR